MSYKKVGWEDAPSSNTPILSASLNQMDDGIEKANKGIVFSYSATFTSDGVLKNTTSTEALGAGSFATSQTDIVTAFVADNVTKIDSGTFSNCTLLKTIYIDNTVGNVEIVSGSVPLGVSIVYSNDDNFINVNELLASAIKSLKKQVNADKSDWENRATSIETQHKTDVQTLNANISQVADNLQIVKETAQREIATTNTNVNGKESLSNKVDVITHPSTNTYPSVKGVWDFVETKSEQPCADIAQNKADIVVLKVDKVDNTDFNAYKTSNDTAVKQNATDIVQLKADVLQNAIKVTTDKSTSIVLNDSSDCNIVDLKLYNTQANLYMCGKNFADFNTYFNRAEPWDRGTNKSKIVVTKDAVNKTITFNSVNDTDRSGINVFWKDSGIPFSYLTNKTITVSVDVSSTDDCKFFLCNACDNYKNISVNTTANKVSRVALTTKMPSDVSSIKDASILLHVDSSMTTVTLSNFQIELSSTATDYENYKESQTVTNDTDLSAIHTYYPNTTIISDSDFEVTYIADTKNYIDNKILEVATALVASESEVM